VKLKVSVIVCARNEEETLAAALESLSVQSIPSSDYEVIIVNDASIDKTSQIAHDFCERLQNFKCIDITEEERVNGILHGKQHCVHSAIIVSHGEYILQLDADCIATVDFIAVYLNHFQDGSSFVFGVTDMISSPSVFDAVQRADLHFMMTVAAFGAKAGLPLSCMGNNMGYLKRDYLEIGGYHALGANMVEDYQLLLAFEEAKKRIKVIKNIVLVNTRSEKNVSTFLRQRFRWSQGLSLPNMSMKILVTIRFAFTIMFWAGFSLELLPLALTVLAIDAAIFIAGALSYGKKGILLTMPLWMVWFYLSPFVILIGSLVTSKKRWK
jgi:cellulose synthase/poly-beta-1,6-N-acetylglucosamine synthase-like glycosyltransferase